MTNEHVTAREVWEVQKWNAQIQRNPIQVGDDRTQYRAEFQTGDTSQGVRVSFNADPGISSVDREVAEVQRLLALDLNTFGQAAKRDYERALEAWQEITGYDRNGQPQYRVHGRDREMLTTRLQTLKRAMVNDQILIAQARRVQDQQRAYEAGITKAAEARAAEMVRDAAIEEQAKLIARRQGVRK